MAYAIRQVTLPQPPQYMGRVTYWEQIEELTGRLAYWENDESNPVYFDAIAEDGRLFEIEEVY